MNSLTTKTALAAAAFSLVAAIAPASAQDVSATPTYGDANLRAGFSPDPWSRSLQAGGNIDVNVSIGGDCGGMVANAPDVDLYYTAGTLPLYISVTADADTTLVVNSPDGRWYCNDDYTGLDPAVVFGNPSSGVYNIWVGTFSSATGLQSASLHISELEIVTDGGSNVPGSSDGLDFSLTPNFGSTPLQAGFPDDPHSVDIAAGGSIDVQSDIGSNCRGYASVAPDYRVDYSAGSLPLYFSVVADQDTTLVVNDPNGQWICDDDSGDGLNPQIVFNNPGSGQYDVWIGTFSQGGNLPSATLYVSELGLTSGGGKTSQSGLDWTATSSYGSVELNAGFTPDPHSIAIAAGGTIDASTAVGSNCRGHVAEVPDYDVYYNAGSYPLYFTADADRDTTLVIHGPDDQWYCDDDSGDGLNPQVVFNNPQSGLYDVWIGTYSDGGDFPPAMLHISEIGATGGTVYSGGGIDWSAEPSYGEVSLNAGFSPDPYLVSLAAGGSQDASQLGNNCYGMVAGNPDFNLDYNAGSLSLYISASSSVDTTIMVNAPDGQWYCSDDYSGLNPAVEFTNPQSGLYNIWVGTFSSGDDLPPATLFISEKEAHF